MRIRISENADGLLEYSGSVRLKTGMINICGAVFGSNKFALKPSDGEERLGQAVLIWNKSIALPPIMRSISRGIRKSQWSIR